MGKGPSGVLKASTQHSILVHHSVSKLKGKSPLRYAGGKSRAVKFLMTKLPSGEITEYREAFLGGGSMAFAFSTKYPDVPIWVNDLYYNLYCFWTSLQKDPDLFAECIHECKIKAAETGVDGHRELFIRCKEEIQTATDPWEIGVRWYILNKTSFSGLTENGTFAPATMDSNFGLLNISKLAAYGHHIKDWRITNQDYTSLLEDTTDSTLIFLDPPYDKVGKNGKSVLYGKNGEMHTGFSHTDFFEACQDNASKILITYDSNPTLREVWDSWPQVEWDLTYTFHSSKVYRAAESKRKELLLANYNILDHSLEAFL